MLRQLCPAPALIAYSAWDDAETRRRTADLGFSMHLRKPVSFQVLKAAQREVPPLRWTGPPHPDLPASGGHHQGKHLSHRVAGSTNP
ncbi:hypothetical protein LP417_18440 [Polaromonas sp. P1-6]|nr:hypothetical protein LP417_18440 [Polaromonas sp. P1-6]